MGLPLPERIETPSYLSKETLELLSRVEIVSFSDDQELIRNLLSKLSDNLLISASEVVFINLSWCMDDYGWSDDSTGIPRLCRILAEQFPRKVFLYSVIPYQIFLRRFPMLDDLLNHYTNVIFPAQNLNLSNLEQFLHRDLSGLFPQKELLDSMLDQCSDVAYQRVFLQARARTMSEKTKGEVLKRIRKLVGAEMKLSDNFDSIRDVIQKSETLGEFRSKLLS